MKRSSLFIIFFIVFIDLVGFGIVIPILPYYAQEYGASAWQLGWLMTSYSLMQFLFAPVWGQVSDRVGRRPVLLMSLLGTSFSMLLLGFAPSLAWLFIGRTFAGICGANISTAYAYMTDITPERNRAKGMGLIGAAFGMGFIFGPAIGGVLSRYGYGFPMLTGAALAFANAIFAYFVLQEPPLSEQARAANRTKRFDRATIRLAFGDHRSRLAIGLFFLVTFAVTQMEVVFAIYLKLRFDYDARAAGVLLAITGLIMALVQGGLIGRLARRFGEPRLILSGALICAAALATFGSSATVPGIVASLCFMALGHGVLHPSLSSLASLGASASSHGATMGVFQSAGSLARVVGPLCAGLPYDQVSPSAPFYCSAVVFASVFAIGWLKRP